jgi:hypothetical protein
MRYSEISMNPRHALYDRNYMRGITSTGQGIEMDDMFREGPLS